jgi:tetratricopeptide (TPR) repeat protein
MPGPTSPGSDGPGDATQHDDLPPEVDPSDLVEDPPAPPPPARARRVPRWAVAVGVVVLLAGSLLAFTAWRRHQQRRIVAISIARAQTLLRSDTWLGAHEAAALLGVRAAQLDPLEAGSLRAFALSLLAADWRDRPVAAEAAALADEAQRAARVPAAANLATATLALADGRGGTAVEYANRAPEGPWSPLVVARVALAAGNADAAAEPVERALTADPEHPAALALKGDLARRAGRAEEARGLYDRARAASSQALAAGLGDAPAGAAPHARATFGLAKLALSRQAPADAALPALAALAADGRGTPQVERARAAMYLAALHGRAGDRAAAAAALDAAGVNAELRGWLERAAGRLEVERGPYRVPDATPAALESASDDDPWVPPPPPPPAPAADAGPQRLHGFRVEDERPAKRVVKHRGAKAKKTAAKGKAKKPASQANATARKKQQAR